MYLSIIFLILVSMTWGCLVLKRVRATTIMRRLNKLKSIKSWVDEQNDSIPLEISLFISYQIYSLLKRNGFSSRILEDIDLIHEQLGEMGWLVTVGIHPETLDVLIRLLDKDEDILIDYIEIEWEW